MKNQFTTGAVDKLLSAGWVISYAVIVYFFNAIQWFESIRRRSSSPGAQAVEEK
jgi:hypothetical protein